MNLLEASEDALRAIRGGTISYVFQDPATALNPVLTIGEQMREAITLHATARGEAARRSAIDWLRRVGIASAEERLGAYPHEFSGGMQQRVCLAMALSSGPSLLIADEPTTALDVTVQVQILRLLRDLQRKLHLSVLLISHDLTVVERIAHRVGVMCAGKLVECGSIEQVLRQPAHPYTRELLRYRPTMALRRDTTR
jgi:ABC-type dipeptide/oligopeptide/nickel transport system ATPase component